MTIVRVNPAGWTQDTSTIDAVHINQIDTNCAKSVDGEGGGLYAPSSELEFAGAGILLTKCNGIELYGHINVNASGGTVIWRLDTSTFDDSSDHGVDYTVNEVHTASGFNGTVEATLDRTTKVPSAGMRIRFVIKHTGTLTIKNDASGPTAMQISHEAWGEVVYDGSAWISSAWGASGPGTVTVNT